MSILEYRVWIPLFIAVVVGSTLFSCSDKSTNAPEPFEVYGRIVYRPLLAGSSSAEFYLYHNRQPIRDASIIVKQDTVTLIDTAAGFYLRDMSIRIGDTLAYVVSSSFGSANGMVIIPDTVSIIAPRLFDTLMTNTGFNSLWHKSADAEGYYAYLQNQGGYVAAVNESQIDTSAEISGENILNIGPDKFWVDALSGSFFSATAPNGRVMPRGVVGAAGNYRDVYIIFSTGAGYRHGTSRK